MSTCLLKDHSRRAVSVYVRSIGNRLLGDVGAWQIEVFSEVDK